MLTIQFSLSRDLQTYFWIKVITFTWHHNCQLLCDHHIKFLCSKCPLQCWPLHKSAVAVVHCSVINGFLRQGRSDQLQCVFQLGNCFLALAAAYRKTPALPPNVISQWIEIEWTGWVMKSLEFDFSQSSDTPATRISRSAVLLKDKTIR